MKYLNYILLLWVWGYLGDVGDDTRHNGSNRDIGSYNYRIGTVSRVQKQMWPIIF